MSAIRKRGHWYFRQRIRRPDGKHERIFVTPAHYGLSDTKVGAIEAGRRRIHEIHNPRVSIVSPPLAAFQSTFLEHSETKNEYSSVKAKRQILRDHLVPEFGPMPLHEITFARIEDFKARLRRSKERGGSGLGAKTGNNVLSVLRRLLAVAKKRGELAAIPDFEWFPTEPAAFDFLTFAEADDLIEAAAGEWRAMILVGLKCGLRQGELLGLQWDDVDLKRGQIVVRRSIVRGRLKGTKSRRHRTIGLGDDVRAALLAHRHLRGPFVFCDIAGHHLTNGECKWPLYHACTGARLRRVGWHILRHTFCSHLAMRGALPSAIQHLAGHSTLRMTERYMHLSPHVALETVKLLDRGAQLVPKRSGTRGKRRESA